MFCFVNSRSVKLKAVISSKNADMQIHPSTHWNIFFRRCLVILSHFILIFLQDMQIVRVRWWPSKVPQCSAVIEDRAISGLHH